MCPDSFPASNVCLVADSSIEISAPELPTPTTRTSPGVSWDGLR